jgi:hypothetical protein
MRRDTGDAIHDPERGPERAYTLSMLTTPANRKLRILGRPARLTYGSAPEGDRKPVETRRKRAFGEAWSATMKSMAQTRIPLPEITAFKVQP